MIRQLLLGSILVFRGLAVGGLAFAGLPALAAIDQNCPTKPLTILLTNDDGFDKPGIRALRTALTKAGHQVTLVGPAANASGSGASITLAPIAVTQPEPGVYAVAGSPATAVILAVTAIYSQDTPPDLVISGINEGANLGPATPISGTVGAAIAAIQALEPPLPAIAVSTDLIAKEPTDPANLAHFERISAFIAKLVAQLQIRKCQSGWLLPEGIALNLNYPPLEPRKLKGIQLLKQGQSGYFRIGYQRSKDNPDSFLPLFAKRTPTNDSVDADTTAYNQGYITIVPIDGDYTADARARSALRPMLERLSP